MDKEKYNGWTNYATWRINLEMIDGQDFDDDGGVYNGLWELSEAIKDQCEEILSESADEGSLALSYAYAFASEVNWYEIAEHVAEAYPQIIKEAK